jgi:hypothetical protein
MKLGDDYGRGLLSRSAASGARSLIAAELGIDDRELAVDLAEAYIRDFGCE